MQYFPMPKTERRCSSKGIERIERRPQEQFQVKRPNPILSDIRRGSRNILRSPRFWICFLLTVGISGFFFWPRISIHPGESFDRYNPFETSFIIKNDGYLPVLDLHYSVKYEDIELKSGPIFRNSSFDLIAKITELKADRSHVISPIRSLRIPVDQVKAATIFFTLSYRTLLIPYRFTEDIRFKTGVKANGECFWFRYYGSQ